MSSLTITQAVDSLTVAVDSLTSSVDVLTSFYTVPPADQFATLWSFGLVLPVSAFLVSLSVGKLLAMIKD